MNIGSFKMCEHRKKKVLVIMCSCFSFFITTFLSYSHIYFTKLLHVRRFTYDLRTTLSPPCLAIPVGRDPATPVQHLAISEGRHTASLTCRLAIPVGRDPAHPASSAAGIRPTPASPAADVSRGPSRHLPLPRLPFPGPSPCGHDRDHRQRPGGVHR